MRSKDSNLFALYTEYRCGADMMSDDNSIRPGFIEYGTNSSTMDIIFYHDAIADACAVVAKRIYGWSSGTSYVYSTTAINNRL